MLLLVHVFNVHRGAATPLYPPHSIHHKFFQHMSILHSYDRSKLVERENGPIATVYNRHVLKRVVDQTWWIEMRSSAPVHAKNVKEKKRVGQVPWRTACVGSALLELCWKENFSKL